MEHVNDWCFRDIYKGGLWDDDLHVCALIWCLARYSFIVQAYGLTHSNGCQCMVQLFIEFFLFLLQISAGNRIFLLRIYFPFLFPPHGHWYTTNLVVFFLNKMTFFFEFGCPGKHNLRWKTFRKIILRRYLENLFCPMRTTKAQISLRIRAV